MPNYEFKQKKKLKFIKNVSVFAIHQQIRSIPSNYILVK